MASGLTQQKKAVRDAFRGVRRSLRVNDTLGEQIERRLDQLINRKTMIQPEDIQKLIQQISNFVETARNVADTLNVVFEVMGAL